MATVQLPYFTQAYFSPHYFPSLISGGSGSATSPGPYFAPSYFAPHYFSGLKRTSQPGPEEALPTFRDRDGFLSLLRLLNGTGEFRHVAIGAGVDQVRRNDNASPYVCVTPTGWSESDEESSFNLVRTVSFRVTVGVRLDDYPRGFDSVDRLSNLVINCINSADLGGTSLPALTRIKQGRLEVLDRLPELCAALDGEFAYLVGSKTSHSINF